MSNYCLRMGPMPRTLAEACTRHLETSIATELQALSLFEADETGAAWQIEAYFGSAEDAAEACRSVKSIAQFAACASTVEELAKTNWVRQSLRGLTAIKVGRFFIHGSHGRALRPSNGIAIEIDAATAFGTGHHGSTRGCLLPRSLRTTFCGGSTATCRRRASSASSTDRIMKTCWSSG